LLPVVEIVEVLQEFGVFEVAFVGEVWVEVTVKVVKIAETLHKFQLHLKPAELLLFVHI
jgi:hypothetical protein